MHLPLVSFAVLEWLWPEKTTSKWLYRFYLLILAVFKLLGNQLHRNDFHAGGGGQL
jgi:hypothetical protein